MKAVLAAILTHLLTYGAVSSSPPVLLEHPTSLVVGREEPATLRCEAAGDPEPEISWWRESGPDGQPIKVTTAPDDPKSHRVLLPAGSLFFLRVVSNRKEDDTGFYWCTASNSDGRVTSKKAKLDIAYLKQNFEEEPLDLWVAKGDRTVLPCSPPAGFPEPTVEWTKNGENIPLNGHPRYSQKGYQLVIENADKSVEGIYQCVANNLAGTRMSHRATLSVYVRPFLIKAMDNRTVDVGDSVDLACVAGGDPPPAIFWTRPGAKQRLRGDSVLHIPKVEKKDDGHYACSAENLAGKVSGQGFLTVMNPPVIFNRPADQKSKKDGQVAFDCGVNPGNASQFWMVEGSDELRVVQRPQQVKRGRSKSAAPVKQPVVNGRYAIAANGRLTIANLTESDEGHYYCLAVSKEGSAISSAKLSLKLENSLPPIIELGPVNHTISRGDSIQLHCQYSHQSVGGGSTAAGSAQVTWLKDGIPLSLVNSFHYALFDANSLQIRDAQLSVSGVYTCLVKTSTGQTSASATVTVLDQSLKTGSTAAPLRPPPELTDFPASPGKPYLIDASSQNLSVTVGWSKPTRVGSSPLRGYLVEYHLQGQGGIWTHAEVQGERFELTDLDPKTGVVFLVRARNEHGLSPPSLLSDRIRLNGGPEEQFDGEGDRLDFLSSEEIRERLTSSGRVIDWKPVEHISSSQVTIRWQLIYGRKTVEKLFLYLWPGEFTTADPQPIVLTGSSVANTYTASGLAADSLYTGLLVPVGRAGIIGKPSSLMQFHTSKIPPSFPPEAVILRLVDATSAILEWQRPHNVQLDSIEGYKVEILTNNSLVGNFSLEKDSYSLILNNLTTHSTYSVRMAAFNSAGLGPYSGLVSLKVEPGLLLPQPEDAGVEPTYHLPYPASSPAVKETWFVSFVGTFSLLTILAAVFLVYLKRRHKSGGSSQYSQYAANGVKGGAGSSSPSSNYMESDTMWISPKAAVVGTTDSRYKTSYYQQEKPSHLYINSLYPPEYAELEQPKVKSDQQTLTNGCYASTDIMEKSFNLQNGTNLPSDCHRQTNGCEGSSCEDGSQSTGDTTNTTGSASSNRKTGSGKRKDRSPSRRPQQSGTTVGSKLPSSTEFLAAARNTDFQLVEKSDTADSGNSSSAVNRSSGGSMLLALHAGNSPRAASHVLPVANSSPVMTTSGGTYHHSPVPVAGGFRLSSAERMSGLPPLPPLPSDDLPPNMSAGLQHPAQLCYSVGNSPYHHGRGGVDPQQQQYQPVRASPPNTAAQMHLRGPYDRLSGVSLSSAANIGSCRNSAQNLHTFAQNGSAMFSSASRLPSTPIIGRDATTGRLYSVMPNGGGHYGEVMEVGGDVRLVNLGLLPSNGLMAGGGHMPSQHQNEYETASIYSHQRPVITGENYLSAGYSSREISDEESLYSASVYGLSLPKTDGSITRQEEKIYSTFKPDDEGVKPSRRGKLMQRRLSDSESNLEPSSRRRQDIMSRISQSAASTPAMVRRNPPQIDLSDLVNDSDSSRVSKDINEMVEQIQAIQQDISELAGRPISLVGTEK